MQLQHVNVKIFLDTDVQVDSGRVIEVFHQWIQEQTLDELLIDVADYRHVPAGPGVVLIGHEADYSLDNTGNRYGLRYNRKAPLDGSNEDRFRQALSCAANACRLLEEEFESEGLMRFSRHEFELFINDRATAPNTDETLALCKPDLQASLEKILGHDEFSLEHQGDRRRLFGVTVRVAQPFDLVALLQTCAAG